MRNLPEPNPDRPAVSDDDITEEPYDLMVSGALVDGAEKALRAFGGDLTREQAERRLADWQHRAALSPRERGAVLARFKGGSVTDPDLSAVLSQRLDHRTRWLLLEGGPVQVHCSCGWGGVAPSVEVAERDAAKHRQAGGA